MLQDAHRGILFRFAKHIDEKSQNIAAGRVRGLRVNSYAASIAMATLLVLLVIGGVEPHPGPTDDKIANGKRDSTSSANDGNHNDRGNAISPPTVDQLFAAISELSQAVNRVEAAQAALSTQQTHNTAAVQQRLAEVEKKLDERLKTLEDSNDVLSVDVGEMSTKVEHLEEENQFIKDRLRNLEEKLDSDENHSKRNNLLCYGIPTAAGQTWSDCEDKVMNIIKTDTKITDGVAIDDLRKSRGLHSVSAYRHGLYIYRSRPACVAQSSHAFVGGTVSTWAR